MIFELHTCCPEHIFDTPLNGVASMFIIDFQTKSNCFVATLPYTWKVSQVCSLLSRGFLIVLAGITDFD